MPRVKHRILRLGLTDDIDNVPLSGPTRCRVARKLQIVEAREARKKLHLALQTIDMRVGSFDGGSHSHL
jgi:hypothetical protein